LSEFGFERLRNPPDLEKIEDAGPLGRIRADVEAALSESKFDNPATVLSDLADSGVEDGKRAERRGITAENSEIDREIQDGQELPVCARGMAGEGAATSK
jgi:hypothetical protein